MHWRDMQMAQEVSDHLHRQLVQRDTVLASVRQALVDTQKTHDSAVKASAADSLLCALFLTCVQHAVLSQAAGSLNGSLGLVKCVCN